MSGTLRPQCLTNLHNVPHRRVQVKTSRESPHCRHAHNAKLVGKHVARVSGVEGGETPCWGCLCEWGGGGL